MPEDMNQKTALVIAGVILLVVGVAIATIFSVFIGVLNGKVYQITESDIDSMGVTYANNQSFIAYANDTWVQINSSHDEPIVNSSIPWRVYNSTGTEFTVNFSMNLTTGYIHLDEYGTPINQNDLNDTTMYISYEYGDQTIRGYLRSSISNSIRATSEISDYIPIIVLAIIIVIIISLIVTGIAEPFLGATKYGGGGGEIF